MKDLDTFQSRLVHTMKAKGVKQVDLVNDVKASKGTVSNWVSGKTEPDSVVMMERLAARLGVTFQWLATGRELVPSVVMTTDGTVPIAETASNVGHFLPITTWDDETQFDGEVVAVPFFKDLAFACGGGAIGEAMQNESRKLMISRLTIERIRSTPDMIFAATALDNSMSPVINDGDTIWVDRTKQTIKNDRIFVFEYGGLFLCKYLYREPNNAIRVVSANKDDYPEFIISHQDQIDNQFVLIGWVWNIQSMMSW